MTLGTWDAIEHSALIMAVDCPWTHHDCYQALRYVVMHTSITIAEAAAALRTLANSGVKASTAMLNMTAALHSLNKNVDKIKKPKEPKRTVRMIR